MRLNPCDHIPEVRIEPEVMRKLLAYQEGTDGYTVNHISAGCGAKPWPHSHPHHQVMYILSGSLIFRADDELLAAKKGDLIQIEPHVVHTWEKIEENAAWIEFFTPERKDYRPEGE